MQGLLLNYIREDSFGLASKTLHTAVRSSIDIKCIFSFKYRHTALIMNSLIAVHVREERIANSDGVSRYKTVQLAFHRVIQSVRNTRRQGLKLTLFKLPTVKNKKLFHIKKNVYEIFFLEYTLPFKSGQ